MPVVWQISVLNTPESAFVQGVILTKAPIYNTNKKNIIYHFVTVLKSYFIRVYANKKITIKIGKKYYQTQTNIYGNFFLKISNQKINNVLILDSKKQSEFKIIQDYPVIFNEHPDSTGVISDIDDTIIVSYTANTLKRISTLIFIPPLKRKIVEFSNKIISLLKTQNINVYYVSKSENNLFLIISSIIKHNGLTEGILFLTPYLQFSELFRKKKGIDFKFTTIEFIIQNTNHKKFILLGDDTQKDMEVYRLITEKYPDKIGKIFIRQTKKTLNTRKINYLNALKKTCKNVVYFDKTTDIEKEMTHLNNIKK